MFYTVPTRGCGSMKFGCFEPNFGREGALHTFPSNPCREGGFATFPHNLSGRFTASTPGPIEGEVCRELALRPYLTRLSSAAYSSLRRKKSHSLPGDIPLRLGCEWSTLASGAIYKNSLLAHVYSKPSLPLADFVTCLDPTATLDSKTGKGIGEGI